MIKTLLSMIFLLVFVFAGNEANVTRTVTVVVPVLTSLSLSSSTTTLNVGETTELTLMGTYSDNTSKTVTQGIAYVITPSNSVEVNGTVLTAKKNGNVTLQAKVGNTLSNKVNLNITWIVNGHTLPPEPDKTLNDSTLLGIDVNNNGVRDDVERWIYTNYQDKHPIHIDIGMQAAKGYNLVLETPDKARAIYHEVDKAAYCEVYYKIDAELVGASLLLTEDIDSQYFRHEIYFNTKERLDAYLKYDTLLSGYTYALPNIEDEKKACNFNTDKYEE